MDTRVMYNSTLELNMFNVYDAEIKCILIDLNIR